MLDWHSGRTRRGLRLVIKETTPADTPPPIAEKAPPRKKPCTKIPTINCLKRSLPLIEPCEQKIHRTMKIGRTAIIRRNRKNSGDTSANPNFAPINPVD